MHGINTCVLTLHVIKQFLKLAVESIYVPSLLLDIIIAPLNLQLVLVNDFGFVCELVIKKLQGVPKLKVVGLSVQHIYCQFRNLVLDHHNLQLFLMHLHPVSMILLLRNQMSWRIAANKVK